MLRKVIIYALAVALTVATVSYSVLGQAKTRVDTVRARGKLICGVSGSTPGFSFPDPVSGRMVGFDADFCWAVAAFLDVPDVEFANLTSASRIPAVISGSVDVVFRTRSEEHTSELQSLAYLVCRLLLEKKKKLNTAGDVRQTTAHSCPF